MMKLLTDDELRKGNYGECGCVQRVGTDVRIDPDHPSWSLLPTHTANLPGKWIVHCPGGEYNEFGEELVSKPFFSRRFRAQEDAIEMFEWLTSRFN